MILAKLKTLPVTYPAFAASLLLHSGIAYALYAWDTDREMQWRQEERPVIAVSLIINQPAKPETFVQENIALHSDRYNTPVKSEEEIVPKSASPSRETTAVTTAVLNLRKDSVAGKTPEPIKRVAESSDKSAPKKKADKKTKEKIKAHTVSKPVQKKPASQNYNAIKTQSKPNPTPTRQRATVATQAGQRSQSSVTTHNQSGSKTAPASSAVNNAVPQIIMPPEFKAAYLHNPKPSYPIASRRLGEAGKVLLLVKVDAQGQASAVTLKQSCGYKRLDQSALKTVKAWTFVPARRGNTSISASVLVPVQFSLMD